MAVVLNNEIILYTKKGDSGTPDLNSSLTLSTGLPIGFDLYDFTTNKKVGKQVIKQNLLGFKNLDPLDAYFNQDRIIYLNNIIINDVSVGPASLCTSITDSFFQAPIKLAQGEKILGYALQGSILQIGSSCFVYSIIPQNDPNYNFLIKIKF